MGTEKFSKIDNFCFFTEDGKPIELNAEIADVEFDYGPNPEVIGKVSRMLKSDMELSVTIENPKISFRGLVYLLGFKEAVRFKCGQIIRKLKGD